MSEPVEVLVSGPLARDIALREQFKGHGGGGNPYHDPGSGRFTGPEGGSGDLPAPIGFRELKDKAKAAASSVGEAAGNAASAVHDATIGNLKEWKADDFGGDPGGFGDKVSGLIDSFDGTGEKLGRLLEKAKPEKEDFEKIKNNLELVGMYAKGFHEYTKDPLNDASNFIADNGNDMSTILHGLGTLSLAIGGHVAIAHPPVGAAIAASGGVLLAAGTGMSYATRAAEVNQTRLGAEPGAASIKNQLVARLAEKSGKDPEIIAGLAGLAQNAAEGAIANKEAEKANAAAEAESRAEIRRVARTEARRAVRASAASTAVESGIDIVDSVIYSTWASVEGIESARDLADTMANRVNDLFMYVSDEADGVEFVSPRFVVFERAGVSTEFAGGGNPYHGSDGRFTSGPGGASEDLPLPIGGFSWKTAVGITKVRTKVAHATHIPTTKSGIKRKINQKIVENEGKIIAGSILVGAVVAGNAVKDHYEEKVNELEAQVKQASEKQKTSEAQIKEQAASDLKKSQDALAAAKADLKEAKAANGEAARERQPGESFMDYMKRLGGK